VARRLTWSREAIDDIEAIANHIERDSPWYAKAVASRFVELAELFAVFPESGRIVPELDEPDFREGFAYNFRLIYQILADRLLVLSVIHVKRQLTPDIIHGRRETTR
jgi:toxin ParE1/3/4